MSGFDPIRPYTGEWPSLNPQALGQRLQVYIPDLSVTDAKIAPGLSPTKLQLIGAKVYRSSAQTIANDTGTDISFNSTVFDQGAFAPTSGSFSTITIPQTGIYQIQANIEWAVDSTGRRTIILRINGVNAEGDTRSAQVESRAALPAIRRLAKGDTIGVRVYQNSGGNLDVTGGEESASLSAVFLGTI